ncbi:MAG: PIG-L deacetylase family protein [Acidimicrobiales bacterium]
MHTLTLGGGPLTVLALGAHSDDVEIGAGGTLLSLAASGRAVRVHWVVFSAPGDRRHEAEASATSYLTGLDHVIETHEFPDGRFPAHWAEVKSVFHDLAGRVDPDLVLTHRRGDRHQDHQVVADLTWNHFRDHLVWQYEIPKYEGDLGQPNAYVGLTAEIVERKVALLEEHFASQRDKAWFDRDTFVGLARLRGIEAGSPTRFAEGFHVEKALFEL